VTQIVELIFLKGCDFMATSSFTRRIVLNDEAVDKIIGILSDTTKESSVATPEYSLNDKEFMEKCLGLSTCKK
jgi:hypothetical protein